MRESRGRSRGVLRIVIGACAALALVVMASACDPGSSGEPSSSTSASGTGTPTETTEPATDDPSIPTPPALPVPTPDPDILVDNKLGAAAATEYFFALVHYARTTGQTQELEAMSSPECQSCTSVAEQAVAIHDSGGWVESEMYTLRDLKVAFPDADQPAYVVIFTLEEPDGTLHNGEGTQEAIAARTYPDASVSVEWTERGFIVVGVNINAG